MTDISNATTPAPPGVPPTVQILQAAMAHRESIRHSFESQRATLAEAIAAQRLAVTQAAANTRQNTATFDTYLQQAQETATAQVNAYAQQMEPTNAAAPVPSDDFSPLAKLELSPTLARTQPDELQDQGSGTSVPSDSTLNLLSTPSEPDAALQPLATQQFLDALKAMIADEISRQIRSKPEYLNANKSALTDTAVS